MDVELPPFAESVAIMFGKELEALGIEGAVGRMRKALARKLSPFAFPTVVDEGAPWR